MPRFHTTRFTAIMTRTMQFALALTLASFAFVTPGSAGQSVKVIVDQARLMRLSANARTIIVGNPIIADVNIQDGKTLIVMGKSSGSTNMIALDEQGREIANVDIIVQSNGIHTMTLYKGSSRISMNCAPNCERSLIVGDNSASFKLIEKQLSSKMSTVKSAANFSN